MAGQESRAEYQEHGTPGPWAVETFPTQYPDLFTYNVIAPRGWTDPHTGEGKVCGVASGLDSEADARLIAAAPKLLVALEALCVQVHEVAPEHDEEGETRQEYIDRLQTFVAAVEAAEEAIREARDEGMPQ